MDGPDSSYSCLVIHICWNVDREDKMEPPIQTEYFLSGGAIVLIFMVLGARAVISFCTLSAMPGYMVEPPDRTTLAYRSFLISRSHFIMLLYAVSCIPTASIPEIKAETFYHPISRGKYPPLGGEIPTRTEGSLDQRFSKQKIPLDKIYFRIELGLGFY